MKIFLIIACFCCPPLGIPALVLYLIALGLDEKVSPVHAASVPGTYIAEAPEGVSPGPQRDWCNPESYL